MPIVDFWYDLASTYSYLSALRIEEVAASRGIDLIWKPFLLGPIFQAQGWDSSPFNLYPAKGRYMVRDIARIAAARGHDFHLPSPFPQNSLKAARLALVASEEGWVAPLTRELYLREFRDGLNIADAGVLGRAVEAIGQDGDAALRRIEAQPVKDALKVRTEQAAKLGIFGAPSFVTEDGELFWGDDRLEQAIDWSTGRNRPG